MRVAPPGASISVVSEPRAVATGSYAPTQHKHVFRKLLFDPVATARGSDTIRPHGRETPTARVDNREGALLA
ncbi:MAG: hypothetical protein DMF74_19880 [Acidobacteria bacterium]|nr:MAG: hypothetical protein DMF74_19880 [Acidobacteriota bacterium]